MDAILTRTSDLPITQVPKQGGRGASALGHLLSAMVHATAERLILPQRGLPPEWFRFPLP